ncbi:MAG: acyl-CoA dehydrogenase [Candidatus Lambdaproteobacteria bacterium]|nr:acyl-CoA dehydrogenase [Candidatus Lambdaproteobacteria bacterium]
MPEVSVFKSDLRELEFALFEQVKLGRLLGKAPFQNLSEADARLILKEAHTFSAEVISPTLRESDRAGCHLTPEGVRVPEALKAVWTQYYANGWNTLTLPESQGGQGAPQVLGAAVGELMSGANTGFYMYPGLSMAAASVIREIGSKAQQELFATKIESGASAGTMVLTEPQAGSDLGLITTKATPQPDGSYLIQGNKIFISGGDHDLAENIVHLVLARIDGASAGTRGLSLFIVPRRRVNPDGSPGAPNDVVCTKVEHKLGINASATCALAFGAEGKCIGWLVGQDGAKSGGQEGEGLRNMFLMMNRARIAVGVQSLSLASTAYLNALAYARTRLQGTPLGDRKSSQGPVAILAHPDVRRMLLEMKSTVEGCRALLYYAAGLEDQAAALEADGKGRGAEQLDYLGLFIPMVKAYLSDSAVHVASLAMQVYGGAGYTAEFPAEQYLRDARIFPIYEGTNGIQALDLVGRKLNQNNGALTKRYLKETAAFLEALKAQKGYTAEGKALARAVAALQEVLGHYLKLGMLGKLDEVALTATRFLEAMAKIVVARLLLEGALAAEPLLKAAKPGSADAQFYQGKIAAARFYARNILPTVPGLCEMITAEDTLALDLPDGGFALGG